MMDNRKTNESDENLNAEHLSKMASDYIQLWQKQWVATMTDPKTQETMREYYSSLSSLYEKNKHIFTRYAEAMNNGQASAAQNETPQSDNNPAGTAAIYATLEQCLDVLERFGQRITSMEARLDKLEGKSDKPSRKTSNPKRKR